MKEHGNFLRCRCVSNCDWIWSVGGFLVGCGRGGEVVRKGNDVYGELIRGEASWSVGGCAVGDEDCVGICIEEIEG